MLLIDLKNFLFIFYIQHSLPDYLAIVGSQGDEELLEKYLYFSTQNLIALLLIT